MERVNNHTIFDPDTYIVKSSAKKENDATWCELRKVFDQAVRQERKEICELQKQKEVFCNKGTYGSYREMEKLDEAIEAKREKVAECLKNLQRIKDDRFCGS